MVSWQVFVRIGFDVAKRKGATFDGIEDGADFITQLSRVWESEKQQYKQMTEKQVRNRLERMVSA